MTWNELAEEIAKIPPHLARNPAMMTLPDLGGEGDDEIEVVLNALDNEPILSAQDEIEYLSKRTAIHTEFYRKYTGPEQSWSHDGSKPSF